jgi:hypothetical protein
MANVVLYWAPMRPQTNRPSKPLSGPAWLLVGLLAALTLAARWDAFHAWIHGDRPATTPACALCLLVQAQVSATETSVAAVAPTRVVVVAAPPRETHRFFVHQLLPPGRAPPVLSSVS